MKMLATLVRGTALLLFGASLGCSGGSSGPVVPAEPPLPPGVSGSPPAFPAVPSTSTVYVGPGRLYDVFIPLHGSSVPTRYVLHPDNTFEMQFASYSLGIFSYRGRYGRTDATFTFAWDDSYIGAPWAATGVLRGDTLGISYNNNMLMSDFINGPYVIAR